MWGNISVVPSSTSFQRSPSRLPALHTRTRGSIQTTRRYSFLLRQQQVSCRCWIHLQLYSKMPGYFFWLTAGEVETTNVDQRWASSLCCVDRGLMDSRLLAGLLPEDDGGRFPLCLWLLWFWRWSSALRGRGSEEITLMKNTRLHSLSYTKSMLIRLRLFPEGWPTISWLRPANEYNLIQSGTDLSPLLLQALWLGTGNSQL